MRFDRFQSGHTFNHFETVGWHQQGFRGRVVAMVGPSDPLHQPFDVFRRSDLDHQIDIPPVNAKVQGTGADNRPQITTHHGRFDLLALRAIKAAVVNADGQTLIIGEPQVVKEDLGLRAGVVKNERGFVFLDLLQNGRDCVFGTTPGPGRCLFRDQHRNVGIWPGIGLDDLTGVGMAREQMRNRGRVLNRGRQPNPAEAGAKRLQTRQRQHQLVAAF